MPYVDQETRLKVMSSGRAETAGELNYMITSLIDAYKLEKGLSYQTVNDIIGALEGAKFEFYHRIARPMEDLKLSLNGDVYTNSSGKLCD